MITIIIIMNMLYPCTHRPPPKSIPLNSTISPHEITPYHPPTPPPPPTPHPLVAVSKSIQSVCRWTATSDRKTRHFRCLAEPSTLYPPPQWQFVDVLSFDYHHRFIFSFGAGKSTLKWKLPVGFASLAARAAYIYYVCISYILKVPDDRTTRSEYKEHSCIMERKRVDKSCSVAIVGRFWVFYLRIAVECCLKWYLKSCQSSFEVTAY